MAQLSTGHVFMSYSRRDEEFLRRIVKFFRSRGIKVWVDNEKLIPGTPIWEAEIEKAILGANAVVVILSPDSKNSVWVRREISYAEQYRKRIFPVLARGDEDSSMTLRLITQQYVDMRQNENSGMRSLYTALSAYFQELDIQERKTQEEKEKIVHAQAEREAAGLEAEREITQRDAHRAAEKNAKEKAAKEAVEKKEEENHLSKEKKNTRSWWPLFGAFIIMLALGGFVAKKLFLTPREEATPTAMATGIVTKSPATKRPATEMASGSYECTDALGCVDVAPGEPIHIAYALVISGPDETLGIDSRTGVEVAIAVKGQVLGHNIQLTGEDEGCSAEGGQAAGTKLAADPTIVAVIGASCSSATRAASPLLSQAGFVIISPSNTYPDLTLEGNPNQHPGYLRTAHNDEVQGAAAAKFAFEKLGVKKAATINDGSLYAESLQAVFARTFKELGGEITSQKAVDPNATDFKSVLTSIAAGEPEFIYHPIFVKAGSLIIKQARQVPGLEDVYLMGADGMFSTDMVKGTGLAIEGVYVSSPDLLTFSVDYQTVFLPKYKELAGVDNPVSIFHAHAFDAANLIFAAIEKVAVQDEDGTLHIPRQALRDAMYATKDFQGLTGNLTCTPTGDCADPHIAIYEYHAGEYPPKRIWP